MFQGGPEFLQINSQKQKGLAGRTCPFPEYGDDDMFGQKLIRI
jgi:hypothetical protein